MHVRICNRTAIFVSLSVVYGKCYVLYDNQINAHALIGQSAMGYCASQTHGKIAGLILNNYIKAIDHKFLWVIG